MSYADFCSHSRNPAEDGDPAAWPISTRRGRGSDPDLDPDFEPPVEPEAEVHRLNRMSRMELTEHFIGLSSAELEAACQSAESTDWVDKVWIAAAIVASTRLSLAEKKSA
jgi:hypothetical protein